MWSRRWRSMRDQMAFFMAIFLLFLPFYHAMLQGRKKLGKKEETNLDLIKNLQPFLFSLMYILKDEFVCWVLVAEVKRKPEGRDHFLCIS